MSENCPACGEPGGPDDVLADDQRWCGGDCRVVSFRTGARDD